LKIAVTDLLQDVSAK